MMESQPDLFGQAEPASYPHYPGSQDAPASKAAARQIAPRAGTLRRRVLDEYLRIYPRGLAADEMAATLEIPLWSIRPRCTELKRMGLLERTPHTSINESGCTAHRLRASRAALDLQDTQ